MILKTAIQQYLEKHGYEQMSLKAVLFDMDGVLYDSMKNHTQAWYKTIQGLGIACTPEEFYMHEGRTGAGTIDILYRRMYGRPATEEEQQRIYRMKSENFNALPEAQRMPGAYELLCQVKAAGLQPVLVTGSGQVSLIDRLNRSFPGIFDPRYMITAFDVKFGKPHPEPYLMGLRKYGIRPNEAFVVENAPLGVEAGVAAGIFTVAVNTGPLPDQVLLDAGADYLLPSMAQLSDDFPAIVRAMQETKREKQ